MHTRDQRVDRGPDLQMGTPRTTAGLHERQRCVGQIGWIVGVGHLLELARAYRLQPGARPLLPGGEHDLATPVGD
ncbi:hypothetical protein, partial [Streptomyces violaceorubidus]|uniref:hypothetical protein n=1 Tax=Streptomyces violaceorubidus TaxID=284042 RepID=UPI001ADFB52C